MKVADIYYQQMEKPDRDYTNAQQRREGVPEHDQHVPGFHAGAARQAEAARRAGGSGRARDQIGLYYESRENYNAAIARLETVVDTYPLYSKSDQVLLGIGDAYAGEAHNIQIAPKLPGAIKERLRAVYQDKAAAGLRQGDHALSHGAAR
jgi:outer membrane protein assembly factor BamD